MSDYQVTIQPSAQKQLNSLPAEIISRIEPRIIGLANDPRPDDCRKLKGRQNRWRIRVGDYRIIYSIDDETFTLYILTVAHRREVYDR
ncbi:type II toxin-antitoxin system RelE/ParE family toxin [Coleofasciculus sp. H7-2]|uniref:type II toxin-antitoxin system RelE family toxin n=1 Tax=Coleofasciculus sp. H7-2 TaxID=3351545 RepID=UPI003670B511